MYKAERYYIPSHKALQEAGAVCSRNRAPGRDCSTEKMALQPGGGAQVQRNALHMGAAGELIARAVSARIKCGFLRTAKP